MYKPDAILHYILVFCNRNKRKLNLDEKAKDFGSGTLYKSRKVARYE